MFNVILIFTGHAVYLQTHTTDVCYLLGRQCTFKHVSQSYVIHWAGSVPSNTCHILMLFTWQAIYRETRVTVL